MTMQRAIAFIGASWGPCEKRKESVREEVKVDRGGRMWTIGLVRQWYGMKWVRTSQLVQAWERGCSLRIYQLLSTVSNLASILADGILQGEVVYWRRPVHLTKTSARLLTVKSWYLENHFFLSDVVAIKYILLLFGEDFTVYLSLYTCSLGDLLTHTCT